MALDKQSQILLEQTKGLNLPPVHTVSPDVSRQQYDSKPKLSGPELSQVKDISILVEDTNIDCRLYVPELNKKLPILIWFHGGGWVIGNVEGSDGVARHLALGSGYAVLSVDYRLSPEVKFPGPLDDCFGVTKWVYQNADKLNIDKDKISVGGDSAGGNLAAAVCLKAKDDGQLPLHSQLLIYPCLDSNFKRRSYIENANDYALTATSMEWFWKQYTNVESDMLNPYVCPLKYADHSDLPQACILVAEHDPLLDEGIDYHNKLLSANVKSQLIEYSGVMHGFYSQIGILDKSKQAMEASCEYLRSITNK